MLYILWRWRWSETQWELLEKRQTSPASSEKICFCLSRIALTLQWFLRKMSKPPELQYRYRVTSVQTYPLPFPTGWCLAEPLKCKIVLIICLNWMLVGLRAPQKPDPYRGPLAISLSLSPALGWSLCRWMSIAAKYLLFIVHANANVDVCVASSTFHFIMESCENILISFSVFASGARGLLGANLWKGNVTGNGAGTGTETETELS